jgi:tRNA U34 2-thiouridine synthase MnmA/TrmU
MNFQRIIICRPAQRERIQEMNVNDIREIARQKGIKPAKMKKSELIRAIQQDEGNPECFSTGLKEECGQLTCLWRDDCDCAGRCR